MAMFKTDPVRPAQYRAFERPLPEWFRGSALGIFVHWGPYSVPAWAEPTGELGAVPREEWYAHNPYAEWYANTIRIEGSPAQQHQQEVHGGTPYDDFLDQWKAEEFDADEVLAVVAATGAGYFIPTAKHHDGVTLWDAPATDGRNTVARGPQRDLVAAFADATRARGLRFGVYYSGGLDWHFSDLPPIDRDDAPAPDDLAYAEYAHDHVIDLIERYRPDILWGDIRWPQAGIEPGPKSLAHAFGTFYDAVPDGVVNDRWGESHWDFRTSEYVHGTAVEVGDAWENCRGIGLSFGHNRNEGPEHLLSADDAVRLLADVVSRGGNLLLNIGLEASGRIPDDQRRTLEGLSGWNRTHGHAVFGAVPEPRLRASDDPWLRWTRTDEGVHAIVDADRPIALPDPDGVLDETTARIGDRRVHAERAHGTILVDAEGHGSTVAISVQPRS
ncbi:alpha-L-fucosidase [Microbacterium sp. NPDC089695]|uniref:alpha-L-fucosidase n=1 Tax=Microbacterium sp. NPDC089695 TaxID=3364198 RepID=UPI003807DD8C